MYKSPKSSAEALINPPEATLRDYIAINAMNGYLANAWQAQELDATGDPSREQMAIVAEISYVMADAMLAARVNP